jgi:hypothetical protein
MEELLLDVRQNTLFRARPATLAYCGGINYLGAKAVTKGIPQVEGSQSPLKSALVFSHCILLPQLLRPAQSPHAQVIPSLLFKHASQSCVVVKAVGPVHAISTTSFSVTST